MMKLREKYPAVAAIIIIGFAVSSCGSSTSGASGGTNSSTTDSKGATPSPTPTLVPNSIHLVLTGDTSMDNTGTPEGTCGESTDGSWTAAMVNPDGSGFIVIVNSDVFRGPGTYPLTLDPTATDASASVMDIETLTHGKQTFMSSSGSIRIEQDLSQAQIVADGGFTQPPDFTSVLGNVHMVVDISC